MSWQHNFIVVDEYDNVVGYYSTKGDATAFAEGECAEGKRDTCVYAITEVATYRFTDEEDE
jgi:hypothetical protein